MLSARDERTLAALLRLSLGARHLSLCFHRVASVRRERELLPKLTMAPAEIDRLVEFLQESTRRSDRWLTMCFDDGYRDSAEYILSRARRFPQVDWVFFVCPEKIERRVGFRWDLAEVLREQGAPVDHDDVVYSPIDVPTENARNDLRGIAADPRFALADVELCREKMADVERRLKALNARYLIDTPLVRAAGQVKSAQDAIMEALERKRPAPPRRRRR